MNYIIPSLGALFGAFIGSFFNVIAIRTIEEKSWWGMERSRCPKCNHLLGAKDLIPFISWISLRGKCRYCSCPIGISYPLTELVFSIWGFVALSQWGLSAAGLTATVGGWFILLNALTDLYSGYIYDHLALTVAFTGLILRIFGGWQTITTGLIGGAAGFAVIAVIIVASRGGMGWGDANLMAGAGTILGWKLVLLATYLGFMIGGFIAIGLLLLKKVKRKDAIPLAPFLATGILITIIWGPDLLMRWGLYTCWPWM